MFAKFFILDLGLLQSILDITPDISDFLEVLLE